MMIGRLISSAILAFCVTSGLLLLMHFLILRNMTEPTQGEAFTLPEIVMPDRQIETKYDTRKPDKPDEPEQPPPELPEPEFESQDLNNELSVAPNLDVKANIGGFGGFSTDGEFLPIVKVAARYPSRAQSRGLEGYCTVQYTVTVTGETRDVSVVDCPQKVFASASVRAAQKFKYKPRVIDGVAYEVTRVQNRFIFQLADDK